jgi:hypothetical protein
MEQEGLWSRVLETAEITVLQDICHRQAIDVLNEYAKSGGIVYNSYQRKKIKK